MTTEISLVAPLKGDQRNEKRRSPKVTSLVKPELDFWLIGGASLLAWPVCAVLSQFRNSQWSINHHFDNLPAFFGVAALLVNYPHFMASYWLAYRRGRSFILKHYFCLLVAPILLFMCLGVGFVGLANHDFAAQIASIVASIPLIHLAPLPQSQIFPALLLQVMYITVGWHYTKQTYGASLVCGAYEQYSLNESQRKILKWSLFSIWWVSFLRVNRSTAVISFFDLSYSTLGLPSIFYVASLIWLCVGTIAVGRILLEKHNKERRLPPLNFITPIVAMFIWWIPGFYQNEYYLYAVPFFHSLQYLPFVYRVEASRIQGQSPRAAHFSVFVRVTGLLAAGFLAFDFIPNSADVWLGTKMLYNLWYVFICGQIFINVHHYFIDHVLWRMQDPETRAALLG